MIENIIRIIIFIYLYGYMFVSNDTTAVIFPDNKKSEVAANEEKNDLFYREYKGTYIDLAREASIVFEDAQVNLEEENIVCLINANNGECTFKAFKAGVSFDNVPCGEYYLYVYQAADGMIVDTTPDVNIYFSDVGASNIY